MYIYIYIYVCEHIYIYVCIYICVCVCVHVHIYTHKRTHTYLHIHLHMFPARTGLTEFIIALQRGAGDAREMRVSEYTLHELERADLGSSDEGWKWVGGRNTADRSLLQCAHVDTLLQHFPTGVSLCKLCVYSACVAWYYIVYIFMPLHYIFITSNYTFITLRCIFILSHYTTC